MSDANMSESTPAPPARIAPSRTQVERLEASVEETTRKMMAAAGVRLSTQSERPKREGA